MTKSKKSTVNFIQIEFKGEEDAPVFGHVTNIVYGQHWFWFKYREPGDKQVWGQKIPVSIIHAVREWKGQESEYMTKGALV